MPRQARMLSDHDMYHVTSRGVGRMDIFLANSDKKYFLKLLTEKQSKGEYDLFAYCLMSNHIHLLLKANDPLQRVIKRICGPYAQYFNKKYDRVGHVFQDRFHSQIIAGERQLLVCARYIHRNPVVAGITSLPETYPWSSYQIYLDHTKSSNLVNRDLLYSVLSPIKADAARELELFTQAKSPEEDAFNFLEPGNTLTKTDVEEIVADFGLTLINFKKAPRRKKREVIIAILSEGDISGRELARILGIAREIIYAIKKEIS